ncbi:HPr kinase/phosphatase C-terminal domain-containing protein [Paracoccus sp. 1_MG-2023]|uniref:HPr kinase/phosphorylase n=1 Tax=unclassified Paracoccus (in: a-proteobacteria) TaxID=2688777 RepID=UPI001C0A31CF|nr:MULTISPECIES: HPr kinase/phosphatase C-terminal domain-containing protein [unclassified Paracoccus (in: a-proteobacteria)]MBU2956498.1 HPr kinase/phosphatase C-terminal domain-containing protein [Paracoccus sp. C2R09]MDO6669698.1 HPr kinase/phosphatase C-terminal domain-containing protein [Paracoccus sp. 1_MG-2023]
MQLHATTVAIAGRGLVIIGPSGSGKSSLALELMATGGMLVADDRTDLRCDDGRLIASAPDALRGRIEARGIGILAAHTHGPVEVVWACDLGAPEAARLPQRQSVRWLGVTVSLVSGPWRPHLHAALRQLMMGGRVD